jgi:catechol 2,3-dioxygenase-like lactoylglutathione lyase family enzyme
MEAPAGAPPGTKWMTRRIVRLKPTDYPDNRGAARVVESAPVAITGMANLAVKVGDLDAAIEFYRRSGARVTDPEEWRNSRRADVYLGPLQITLFTRALYEDEVDGLPGEGFLHVALFTDDLDREIDGHAVVWGPEVVSGPTFGTRRIVFVDAPGRMRLELMEQLEEPA